MTAKRDHISNAELVGRLGKTPELQHTEGGDPYVRMSIATSESYTAKNGTIQDKTEWHQAVAWGTKAEEISRAFAKGDSVVLTGDLRVNSYDKDGVKNRVTELHVGAARLNHENESSRNATRLVGEVREPPVARRLDSSVQMTTLSIATRTMADGRDGPREREDWHRVTLWGKTAEAANDIKAGDTVAINGSLRHRTVPGENGHERKLSAIDCHKFQVLERAPERRQEAAPPGPSKGLSESIPGDAGPSGKPGVRSRAKGAERGL
jgi:single stranded DNA-binding protein